MQGLVNQLENICVLLEQINDITANQTAVLLQKSDTLQEENIVLDMLEQMVTYKEQLTVELLSKEKKFDESYEEDKDKIKNNEDIKVFKKLVSKILTLKQDIVEKEQKNVLIMQNNYRERQKVTEVLKMPTEVINAYLKQKR